MWDLSQPTFTDVSLIDSGPKALLVMDVDWSGLGLFSLLFFTGVASFALLLLITDVVKENMINPEEMV